MRFLLEVDTTHINVDKDHHNQEVEVVEELWVVRQLDAVEKEDINNGN